MNSIDIFFDYKSNIYNIPASYREKLTKLLKVNKKIWGDYVVLTYSLKTKRNESDDKLYGNDEILLKILPRACSFVIEKGRIVYSRRL